MRFRRKPQPAAPGDVRVRLRDGSTIGVECVYNGLDEDGLHEWMITSTLPMDQVVGITVDVLPGKTTVIFPFA